jgi:hypothetical protein
MEYNGMNLTKKEYNGMKWNEMTYNNEFNIIPLLTFNFVHLIFKISKQ